MGILGKIVMQAKKPSGLAGRLLAAFMNREHSGLTDWALGFLPIKRDDTVLDIGCGGGRTVNKLANRAAYGKVFGVDYSEESVRASSRLNRYLIADGWVQIKQASVSSLPFPDNTFDAITAIETYFFWPDLANDMREVLRVLKPGGRLLIVSERYIRPDNRKQLELWKKASKTEHFMHYQTKEEFGRMFADAGYVDVEIHENGKGAICGIGRKKSG